jgi:sulfite exporter TauE/SafE/copper chaperone CopZ
MSDSKHCRLFVDGMHCASCEILIEKKLLKKDYVQSVDASLKDGTVQLEIDRGAEFDVEDINQEFKELGYEFARKRFKKVVEPPLLSINSQGELSFNPKKMRSLLKLLAIFFGFIILFFIFENLQLGRYVSVDENSSLPAFLLLGLVAGVSSCAALIGGLLLSMTKQWNELYIDSDSSIQKFQPHALFHVGRLISFFLFGGLLGLVGEAISLNNATIYSLLTILISVVMFILALQMLDVRWAQNFRFAAPKSLTRVAADESRFQGRYMPFLIGVATFLLPCGFTLIAQGVALASGNFLQGAFIMTFFALGTLPMLLGISLSGVKLNSKPHLTAKFNVVAGLVIIFFVIYNVNGQLNVLGLPSLSDINLQPSPTMSATPVALNPDGEQVVSLKAEGFSYIPTSSMTIKAGIPTKLIVDNQGILGCGAFMAARGLIDNFVALQNGQNVIDLGSPRAGTYKITCSMGMVAPVNLTVI